MNKNKTIKCPSWLSIFSLLILFISMNGEQLFAQEKNEIDERRKTIINVKDTLVKLYSHVYAILSDGEAGNIAIYENPDGLVLVDDQWVELLPKVKKLLATISSKPVRYVLNTHFHYDHSDGNKVFGKEGAIIISHDNIRKRLEEKQVLSLSNLVQKAYPFEALPFITFSDSLTLNEPNEKIKIYHVKNAHTDGDSFIEFINANVIHTGDVFVRYGFPYIDDNNGGNIYGMIEAIDMLINSTNDSTKIIPGHGPISNKKELISYRDMLITVVSRVQNAIESSLSIEQIKEQNPLRNLNLAWNGFFNLEKIYDMVKMKLEKKE
jgi:glyoxylase-like metal-dependent hydrolase (beta-lactamase superfamily II)